MTCAWVRLDYAEAIAAIEVGARRQLDALFDGRPDRHGFSGDGWGEHIEGACGEQAFAKHLGVYWDCSVNTFRTRADVGEYHVRTRREHTYELLIRPTDPDDGIFVLVTGRLPLFAIRGGILGRDAKRDEWRQTHGGRPPAFFVPHAALSDVSLMQHV